MADTIKSPRTRSPGRTHKFPNVTDAEMAHLQELARRIVNKVLNDPVQVLRRGDGQHTPANQYLHALEKLFQLEDDPQVPGEKRAEESTNG